MLKKFLLKMLLERAIAFEEKAYLFYETALARSAMSETSELLKRLVAEELVHRMKLEEMQRSGDLGSGDWAPSDPGRLAVSGDSSLEGIEEGIEELPDEWPVINPWAHKREILEMALQKETKAYRFYKSLAAKAHLKAAREVFATLSREESAHVELLRKEIEKA